MKYSYDKYLANTFRVSVERKRQHNYDCCRKTTGWKVRVEEEEDLVQSLRIDSTSFSNRVIYSVYQTILTSITEVVERTKNFFFSLSLVYHSKLFITRLGLEIHLRSNH